MKIHLIKIRHYVIKKLILSSKEIIFKFNSIIQRFNKILIYRIILRNIIFSV